MFKILIISILATIAAAQFTSLQWSTCPGVPSKISILNLRVSPMPILNPSITNLTLYGQATAVISGKLKSVVNIIRTVSGLPLPIRCYLNNGNYVGSCTYDDLCELLNKVLNVGPANCPASLVNGGLDCKCPYTIAKDRFLDVFDGFDIPDFAGSPVDWLASGDFNVDVNVTDTTTQPRVLCMNLKFSMAKAPPTPGK